jgi:hypothetical protein
MVEWWNKAQQGTSSCKPPMRALHHRGAVPLGQLLGSVGTNIQLVTLIITAIIVQ